MKSEWEELESLSKNELIIELVKERTMRRDLNRRIRQELDDIPNEDERLIRFDDEGFLLWGAPTTDEWAKRILIYAKEHQDDVEFGSADSMDYGLDEDQAERVFDELANEGILDWPSDDARSKRFSGVSGMYSDEVEDLDPEERERLIREERGE